MFKLLRLCDFRLINTIKLYPTEAVQCPLNIAPNTSVRGISLSKNQQLKVKDIKLDMNHLPDLRSGLKRFTSPLLNNRFLRSNKTSLYSTSPQDCPCDDEQPVDDPAKIWRILTLYVCLPTILLGSYLLWQHEKEPHQRQEFIPYDNLRIRTRPFPWGDGNHSFFHNKCLNALPEGYENDAEGECSPAESGETWMVTPGMDLAKDVLKILWNFWDALTPR